MSFFFGFFGISVPLHIRENEFDRNSVFFSFAFTNFKTSTQRKRRKISIFDNNFFLYFSFITVTDLKSDGMKTVDGISSITDVVFRPWWSPQRVEIVDCKNQF